MKFRSIGFLIFLLIAFPYMSYSVEVDSNNKVYVSFYDKIVKHLLANYRLPQEKDFKFGWKQKESYAYQSTDDENKVKAPYWTKGFFNEDEAIDFAYILINKQDNKKYLYAIISEGVKYRAIQLGKGNDFEMGTATQQRGKILTASGKGYWEPTKDDPPEVFVKRSAISYFMFESAASLFIWYEKENKFKRHWISD